MPAPSSRAGTEWRRRNGIVINEVCINARLIDRLKESRPARGREFPSRSPNYNGLDPRPVRGRSLFPRDRRRVGPPGRIPVVL